MTNSEELVGHMRHVQAAERDLRDLGMLWQMIESSAEISCPVEVEPILPTLAGTRERFNALRSRLVRQMAHENEAELGDALSAKAQCAIDILVRNLYERTADVGFLATDDVVRAFCAASPEQRLDGHAAMRHRLAEYQAKYTVYDDVVLLAPDGEVLARLDGGGARSADPIVTEALAANGFVERFRASDLAAGDAPALLYAQRIQSADARAVGVLVLRFRFADEMQRIFTGLGDVPETADTDAPEAGHATALLLIDDAQRVIASNDEAHIPIGVRLPRTAPGRLSLVSFAGREYLALCCASQGYQGYAGPGWRAMALVSLLTAFGSQTDRSPDDAGEMALDNAELLAIQADAEIINRDLRRVVWNGRLMASQRNGDRRRLNAVLRQINLAGRRTRERVDQSVAELYRTSLARARHQARGLARMAADIMDRNLYERANDCRWWALSPVIRQVLSAPASPQGSARLNAVLDHINGLYTVYSRLVVFDAQGIVRGASQMGDGSGLLGRTIAPAWQQAVQQLGDSQRYAVSDFEPTTLHEHGATYVYLAAVRDDSNAQRIAGGIAIVFHAAREFAAMLGDVIGKRDGFAAFIDADGHVLAASDTERARGAAIDFAGEAALPVLDGVHFACARAPARGYREFKNSDGYDNRIGVVVGLRLGAAGGARMSHRGHDDSDLSPPPSAANADLLEVAMFRVGAMRLALPAAGLTQAVSARGMVRTPGSLVATAGLLEVPIGAGTRMVQVLNARHLFDAEDDGRQPANGVVLVLHSPDRPTVPPVGLLVDDVLAVAEFDRAHVRVTPHGFQSFAPWVVGLMEFAVAGDGPDSRVLVQLLDPAMLTAHGAPGHATAALDARPMLALAG